MAVCNCLVSVVVISSLCVINLETTCESKWSLDIVSWGNSVTTLNWKLMRGNGVRFPLPLDAHCCIPKQTVSRQGRWTESKLFKLSFAPWQHINSCLPHTDPKARYNYPTTAQHWIADEMRLFLKRRCFTLSLPLTLSSPALSLSVFIEHCTFSLSLITSNLD